MKFGHALIGAALFLALPTLALAQAPAACDNPATWAVQGEHLLGFSGPAFMRELARLMPGSPQPPEIAATALVVAYIGDGDEVRLHFFDARGCDLGPWAKVSVEVLHVIDRAIGTPA